MQEGCEPNKNDSGRGLCMKCIVVVVMIVLVLISILIAVSFGYLDYYELAFTKQKSTGVVDKSKVYDGGRYFIGPDYTFKVFQADVHFVDLENSKVFSADKLEVIIAVHFQYVIRKDELKSLHDKYDLDYKSTIESRAVDALKGSVTVFNVRELISNRSTVEKTIFKTIRERLGGRCCNYLCGKTDSLCSQCIDQTRCSDDDKGLNVEVKYLQLLKVDIPDDIDNRFVKALVEQEQAQEELLKQRAAIVRKETTQQVQVIKNAAKEISENATAQAHLITTMSRSNYTAALEGARSEGLKLIFTQLGITNQSHKNSFNYLRTIRGQENTHLTISYQQRIAGNI